MRTLNEQPGSIGKRISSATISNSTQGLRGEGLGALNCLNFFFLRCCVFLFLSTQWYICDYVCMLDNDYTIIKYMTCCMHINCIICMVKFFCVLLQEGKLDNSGNWVKNIGI